jgi:hypothetical protein
VAKHKYIETPEAMWELFEAYKKWCKDNPRYSYALATKTGEATAIPLERPLTQVGFRSFAADKGSTVNDYFCNKDGRYSEYATICSRIEEAIRMDQIEGGMVGQYNPSITQRLNNLTERVDTTTNGENINDIKVKIILPSDDSSAD